MPSEWMSKYDQIKARNLARRDDPDTSKQAAERLVASGSHGARCEAALSLVRALPGATASELDPSGFGSRILKRLNDLRIAGAIRKGEDRKCRVSKRMAATWWVEGLFGGER